MSPGMWRRVARYMCRKEATPSASEQINIPRYMIFYYIKIK